VILIIAATDDVVHTTLFRVDLTFVIFHGKVANLLQVSRLVLFAIDDVVVLITRVLVLLLAVLVR
jgi:hypothetical protein